MNILAVSTTEAKVPDKPLSNLKILTPFSLISNVYASDFFLKLIECDPLKKNDGKCDSPQIPTK